jgi:hypothetical protein
MLHRSDTESQVSSHAEEKRCELTLQSLDAVAGGAPVHPSVSKLHGACCTGKHFDEVTLIS